MKAVETLSALTEAARCFNDRQLVWLPGPGIGYFPIERNGGSPYDEAYFERYRAMESTNMGLLITQFRTGLVERYAGTEEVKDIGCGSGAFVRARGGKTFGTEVNPCMIEILDKLGIRRENISPCENATYWDSLEHLPAPWESVAAVRSQVFVSIPIFQNAEHALQSKHFRPTEHYWYFTQIGLVRFFDALGFSLVYYTNCETRLGREDIGTFVFARRAAE